MAEENSFWTGVVVATVIAAGLYYCSEQEKVQKVQPINSLPVYSASDAVAGAEIPLPKVAPKPPLPLTNYETFESGVYYYVAVATEIEKKKGITTGDVVGFRYHGKNENGEHVLQQVSGSGRDTSYFSMCSVPCKLIRHDDGSRTAYRTSSIIGAALEDVMRGYLKQQKPKRQAAPMKQYWENDTMVVPVQKATTGPVFDNNELTETDEAAMPNSEPEN